MQESWKDGREINSFLIKVELLSFLAQLDHSSLPSSPPRYYSFSLLLSMFAFSFFLGMVPKPRVPLSPHTHSTPHNNSQYYVLLLCSSMSSNQHSYPMHHELFRHTARWWLATMLLSPPLPIINYKQSISVPKNVHGKKVKHLLL